MKKKIWIGLSLVVIIIGLVWLYQNILMHQSAPSGTVDASRPVHWATPVDKPGLRNFYKVSDRLYRGAQPEEEGIRQLEQMGIKTILSLELFHTDRSAIDAAESKMSYEHIYMQTWRPSEKDVIRFLKLVSDTTQTPVFVHCYHGSDRTGTMCAVYRIVMQDWSKEEAIREMREGGYGFHSIWKNLIEFIHELDGDKIRQSLSSK